MENRQSAKENARMETTEIVIEGDTPGIAWRLPVIVHRGISKAIMLTPKAYVPALARSGSSRFRPLESRYYRSRPALASGDGPPTEWIAAATLL